MILWDARIDFIRRGMPGPLWFDYVRREQIDVSALAKRGINVIVCKCRGAGRRRFEFDDENGIDAAVIEVFDSDEEAVTDLCAWPLDAPEQFATLLGRTGVLGAAALRHPSSFFAGQSLRAWQTPLDWLKANATGFAIIDQQMARRHFKTAAGRKHAIQCDDSEHCFKVWRTSGLRKDAFVYFQD